MFRKFLRLFSSNKTSTNKEDKKLSIKPSETNDSYSATGFEDITEGLQFSPTFLFRTPSEILKANGMCVDTKENIPDFLKDQQHGVWLPKLNSKYSLDDSNDVGASDAYGVGRDDYIKFVTEIKYLFAEKSHIFERVKKIDNFKKEHPELKYIEDKLLQYYSNHASIIDILIFNISYSLEDLASFHYRDEGYLKQIFDINTRIEKSLISSGYKTAENVILLTKKQLVELDGIGSKSAEKILNKGELVKSTATLQSHNKPLQK